MSKNHPGYSLLRERIPWGLLLVVFSALAGASWSKASYPKNHVRVHPQLQWKYGWQDGSLANTTGSAKKGHPLPAGSSYLTTGYSPSNIASAYGFDLINTNGDGRGRTIAIIIPFATSTNNLQKDLDYFSDYYGLPKTTLQIHTPNSTNTPYKDTSQWYAEATLDVEWAHAMAPGASIAVVIAPDDYGMDSSIIGFATDKTNGAGADVVSMSWAVGEYSDQFGDSRTDWSDTFTNREAVYVAASGDDGVKPAYGNGVEWPAADSNVVSVGGTTMIYDTKTKAVLSEKAWKDGSGGRSKLETIPPYQNLSWYFTNRSGFFQSGGYRCVPDVSYNGDTYTGVSVWMTDPSSNMGGWYVFGGTSAGTPQWAALIARRLSLGNSFAGNIHSEMYGSNTGSYFWDITQGNNGYPAATGYDLPSGLGVPIANAFVAPSASPKWRSSNPALTGASASASASASAAEKASASASARASSSAAASASASLRASASASVKASASLSATVKASSSASARASSSAAASASASLRASASASAKASASLSATVKASASSSARASASASAANPLSVIPASRVYSQNPIILPGKTRDGFSISYASSNTNIAVVTSNLVVAHVSTSLGSFDMQLFTSKTPATASNFIKYATNGSYSNMLIHRSVPGFVIQTGGYKADSQLSEIPKGSPIQGEAGIPNTRGTVSMALVGTNPDSATDQWFVNLADNTSYLDYTNRVGNPSFSVFGRILSNGMSVLDSIATVPVFSLGDSNSPFASVPLKGVTNGQKSLYLSNLLVISNVIISTNQTPVVTFLGTGTATLSASVSGKDFSNTITITPIPQTIEAFPAVTTLTNGTPATLAIPQSTSGLPVSLTIRSGPGVVTSSSSSAITVSPFASGTITLVANQPGNSFYLPAPEATNIITVSPGSQSITFATPSTNSMTNGSTNLHATSSSGLPVRMTSGNTNVAVVSSNIIAVVTTSQGTFSMELLASNAPATVANFLSYVGQGGYNTLLIHRAISGFVVQTGGFTANANLSSIPVQAPVRGEPGVSNIRGTVAMALSTGPNSGTSQWFVNLADNSSLLDGTNDGGPFTVFARVLTNGLTTNGFPTNGMSIVDQIGSLQTMNISEWSPGFGAFTDLPIQGTLPSDGTLQIANLVTISNITFADPVVTFVGSGTATITASQPGNGDWKAAANVLRQLIIRP